MLNFGETFLKSCEMIENEKEKCFWAWQVKKNLFFVHFQPKTRDFGFIKH